jgi:hypothetical protein
MAFPETKKKGMTTLSLPLILLEKRGRFSLLYDP